MLTKDEDYREQGGNYFDLQNKPKVVNRLVGRLMRLGYYVMLHSAPAAPTTGFGADLETKPSAACLDQPTTRRRGSPCKCDVRGITYRHQSAYSWRINLRRLGLFIGCLSALKSKRPEGVSSHRALSPVKRGRLGGSLSVTTKAIVSLYLNLALCQSQAG